MSVTAPARETPSDAPERVLAVEGLALGVNT